MTTAVKKNPATKSAKLRSVTAMAESIDYGDEMEKQLRIWDELVRDVRADAYALPPLRRSTLDDYDLAMVMDGSVDYSDTPLFAEALRDFNAAQQP